MRPSGMEASISLWNFSNVAFITIGLSIRGLSKTKGKGVILFDWNGPHAIALEL